MRFQLAGLLERCRGGFLLLVAVQEQHHVGVLDMGDGRIRRQLQRGLDMRLGLGRLGAVGQAADHRADLADDLGVVERQRGMRLGMLRGPLERGFQRDPHFTGDALLERLGDADALAVAAQGEGMAVMTVRLIRQRLDRRLGELGRMFETLELFGFVVHQIRGMDADRLHRH